MDSIKLGWFADCLHRLIEEYDASLADVSQALAKIEVNKQRLREANKKLKEEKEK